MSVSEEFKEYVLDLLHSLGDIQTKRMFSGILLEVEGKQLGVILDNVLYFKVVDENLQVKYKSKGSKQFSYNRKDKKNPIVIKNWWSVPDSALDNEEEILTLAKELLV